MNKKECVNAILNYRTIQCYLNAIAKFRQRIFAPCRLALFAQTWLFDIYAIFIADIQYIKDSTMQ